MCNLFSCVPKMNKCYSYEKNTGFLVKFDYIIPFVTAIYIYKPYLISSLYDAKTTTLL